MTTKQIEVQILGKNFNFNVPDNIATQDFIDIVEYVEQKFSRIRKQAGDLDAFRLGLLVAINITEESFYIKKENENFRAVLSNIDSMLPSIDDVDGPNDKNNVDQAAQLSIQFSS